MAVKIKTRELQGAALDWAVCEAADMFSMYPKVKKNFHKMWFGNSSYYIHPSTRWAQGGQIIERERISVWEFLCRGIAEDYTWVAETESCRTHGPTPLIAAMRCYVASKLGDEVEIPEELK